MGLRSRVASIFRRGRVQRTDDELKGGIAKFYDESSSIWIDVWGEDMHHGYYKDKGQKDHKAAQVAMIDNSLAWAYQGDFKPAMQRMKAFVDVGCGVGGSSRHIARTYGSSDVTGEGLSLSPYQIQRAQEFTQAAGLQEKLTYRVADAMKMPFADNSFDLAWSMESGEHMPDKRDFLRELLRVTAPGGRVLVVTWCHRELAQGETTLTDKELRLLDKINRAYYLPDWVPVSDYVKLGAEMGLEDVRQEDWSEFVAPFWPAVIRSALVPRNFLRMMRTGGTTIKGAVASLWMQRGFRKGVVKFVLFTGRKPLAPATEPAPAVEANVDDASNILQ
ncbi:gamma-tocopherol methyltransferase [Ochromonadaceae sp. CCMP2298]|nr:gamma-tocopherol methyltransferase [Ochromonadaceae sp. CCMP2298]